MRKELARHIYYNQGLNIGTFTGSREECFGSQGLDGDSLSGFHFTLSDHRPPSSMAFSDSSRRQSLIPSFLYSSSTSSSKTLAPTASSPAASNLPGGSSGTNFMIPAPNEPGKIEMYSPAFYAACTFGGILSCGLTHMTVTPLDLVKCNMQVLISLDLPFCFLNEI